MLRQNWRKAASLTPRYVGVDVTPLVKGLDPSNTANYLKGLPSVAFDTTSKETARP